MDLRDKHRELILAVYIMKLNIVGNAQYPGIGTQMPWEIRPRNIRITGPPTNMEMKANMSIEVTLREFSGRDDAPLIPTLQDFLRFTIDAVESFAEEFA